MLEKYAKYTVEDFVKDDQFILWSKYSTWEEPSVWQDLVKDYPYQTETVLHARQIVLQLDEASRKTIDPADVEDIWMNIERAISSEEQKGGRIFNLRWFFYLAASVLLVVGLVWWNGQHVTEVPGNVYASLVNEAGIPMEEVINTAREPKIVTLSDGSRVTLEPGSRLSYAKSFDGKVRKVILSGAAFFEVTKNPEKPFLVYANELVTKVLGTSFAIRAFETDKRVTVSVKTGKVLVTANKTRTTGNASVKEVALVPNQKAVFSRAGETMSRTLVERPVLVIPEEELKQFAFSNAPVSGIFEALQKAYGIEILFDKELLSGCHLTTSLSNETLYERLDVICEAIDAHYKVEDGQIKIDGKKCN